MADYHQPADAGSAGSANRQQLQQLQYSHFHHPFPSTHHPYALIQQQERQMHQHQQQQHQHHPHIPHPPPPPPHFEQQPPPPPSGPHMPQNIGFLHPDHLADAPPPPPPPQGGAIVSGGVHTGFPPPAQPSFFPGTAAGAAGQQQQQPQFHHPGHAHLLQHAQPMHHPLVSPGAPPYGSPHLSAGMPADHPDYVGHHTAHRPSIAGTADVADTSTGSTQQVSKKTNGKTPRRRSKAAAAAESALTPENLSDAKWSGAPPAATTAAGASAGDQTLHMHNATVPTRKQNQSCDNCRRRKIACRPPPSHVANPHRRCAHCLSKGVDCTHEYVSRIQDAKSAAQQPPSKKAAVAGGSSGGNKKGPEGGGFRSGSRSASVSFQQRANASSDEDDGASDGQDDDDRSISTSVADRSRLTNGGGGVGAVGPNGSAGETSRDESYSPAAAGTDIGLKRKRASNGSAAAGSTVSRKASKVPRTLSFSGHLQEATRQPAGPRLHPTAHLIRYLLSPGDSIPLHSAVSPFSSSSFSASNSYMVTPLRLPIPTASAKRLATDTRLRCEVVHDLVESFLMIVNPRFALLDARRVRAGIYPFVELELGDDEAANGTTGAGAGTGLAHMGKGKQQQKRKSRRIRTVEDYLYRSDTDGEQDDGGLPSCAPPSQSRTLPGTRASLPSPPAANGKRFKTSGAKSPGVNGISGVANKPPRPRPLPDVLVAVVLAFGAKFSSHKILAADRADSVDYLRRAWVICKQDFQRRRERKRTRAAQSDGSSDEEEEDNDDDEEDDEDSTSTAGFSREPSILLTGRSTIAKSLLIKAQDVLEKRRAFALPTLTNVQAALLMEPLYDQGVRLHEKKRGTPKWEVLADLLQQMEEGGHLGSSSPSSGAPSLSTETTRELLRTASVLRRRSCGGEASSLDQPQPSLDFCGFWHGVALQHLLELRLHEADFVRTLPDIDILTARSAGFLDQREEEETEGERERFLERLRDSVESGRAADGRGGRLGNGSSGTNGEMNGGAAQKGEGDEAVDRAGDEDQSDAAIGRQTIRTHSIDAVSAAIGATNSLSTLAQSAWWMATTSDAITSAFFRKRPSMRPDELLNEGMVKDSSGSDTDEGSGASGSPARPRARTSSDEHTHSGRHQRSPAAARTHERTKQGDPVVPSIAAFGKNRKSLSRYPNTGGVTREAGPDPYEDGDDDDMLMQDDSVANGQAAIQGSKATTAAATTTLVPTTSSSPLINTNDAEQRRARAKREKLALLGERVSLPEKDSYQIWYTGISELSKLYRLMWDTLWSPGARAHGVRLRPLQRIQRKSERWRRTYLPKLGVPYETPGAAAAVEGEGQGESNKAEESQRASWPQEWDFIAASTANMLSLNGFALDVLLWQAVEDHGIAEARDESLEEGAVVAGENGAGPEGETAKDSDTVVSSLLSLSTAGVELDKSKDGNVAAKGSAEGAGQAKKKEELSPSAQAERSVCNNALAASLRIAALVEVLRANYYLRLDPNILHFTIHAAGQFLVTYDNPAVYSIIEGLKQYGLSYEEGLEQADQLEAYALAARIPHKLPAPPAAPPAHQDAAPASS